MATLSHHPSPGQNSCLNNYPIHCLLSGAILLARIESPLALETESSSDSGLGRGWWWRYLVLPVTGGSRGLTNIRQGETCIPRARVGLEAGKRRPWLPEGQSLGAASTGDAREHRARTEAAMRVLGAGNGQQTNQGGASGCDRRKAVVQSRTSRH